MLGISDILWSFREASLAALICRPMFQTKSVKRGSESLSGFSLRSLQLRVFIVQRGYSIPFAFIRGSRYRTKPEKPDENRKMNSQPTENQQFTPRRISGVFQTPDVTTISPGTIHNAKASYPRAQPSRLTETYACKMRHRRLQPVCSSKRSSHGANARHFWFASAFRSRTGQPRSASPLNQPKQ